MFLHTGGKMDMKLVWDVRARDTEMPIQYVITKQHQQQQQEQQLTNGDQDGRRGTKETKALMELLLQKVWDK